MKFGIDSFGLDHGRSGLGAYLLSLVNQLPDEKNISYQIFGPETDRYCFAVNPKIDFISTGTASNYFGDRAWHLYKANIFASKNEFDAILYTAGARLLPLEFSVPGVAVINDIPSKLLKNKKLYKKLAMKKSLNKVDYIIAASNFIKRDLEKLGIKNKNIEVIHNGIDHSMFYPKELDDSEYVNVKPFAIQRPYFIYASTISSEEKKHVELIKAFSLFKKNTGLPHRLVLAGKGDGNYAEKVHKAAFESDYSSDIFLTGYFPHETFPDLYRGATACICPSVNEGVGLTVLESMACGLPVACAKAGALPELAASNALYFNSDSILEIEGALEKLAVDENLRKKLSQQGVEWAKRFSWEKTAHATAQFLLKASRKE